MRYSKVGRKESRVSDDVKAKQSVSRRRKPSSVSLLIN